MSYITRSYAALLRVLRDESGQDLVEYALLVGLVATAAGSLLPGVSSSFSTIFSNMRSLLSNAAG